MSTTLPAWLRLFRLPNLLTVPGDPLAGYLLAAGAGAVVGRPLLLVLLASLLLYLAGLIMNDVVDARLDARERPERPIPSGQVDEAVARLVGVTAAALALLLARHLGWSVTGWALALLLSIVLYNRFLKSGPLGPLAMGLCRAFSLLMGAALVGWPPPLVWVAAGGLALYIALTTVVARGEMASNRSTATGFLPLLAVAVTASVLLAQAPVQGAMQVRLGMVLFLLFSGAGLAAWRLKEGAPAPAQVGFLISLLLYLQAAYCLAADAGPLSLAAGLGLLLAWPLNRLLARGVASS